MKQQFLVVGLGSFGSSVARSLTVLGQEVLALDIDERRVEDMKTEVTHVAQGDATEPQVFQAIDISQFEAAVVAIGDSFEASILTTLALKQANVPYVMARAVSVEQVRILQLLGADRVIFPEVDAGELAAYQLINRHMIGFLRLDEHTSVATVEVGSWAGTSPRVLEKETRLRALGVFRGGRVSPIGPDESLAQDDTVLLAGSNDDLHSIARLR